MHSFLPTQSLVAQIYTYAVLLPKRISAGGRLGFFSDEYLTCRPRMRPTAAKHLHDGHNAFLPVYTIISSAIHTYYAVLHTRIPAATSLYDDRHRGRLGFFSDEHLTCRPRMRPTAAKCLLGSLSCLHIYQFSNLIHTLYCLHVYLLPRTSQYEDRPEQPYPVSTRLRSAT